MPLPKCSRWPISGYERVPENAKDTLIAIHFGVPFRGTHTHTHTLAQHCPFIRRIHPSISSQYHHPLALMQTLSTEGGGQNFILKRLRQMTGRLPERRNVAAPETFSKASETLRNRGHTWAGRIDKGVDKLHFVPLRAHPCRRRTRSEDVFECVVLCVAFQRPPHPVPVPGRVFLCGASQRRNRQNRKTCWARTPPVCWCRDIEAWCHFWQEFNLLQ